jgi:DHA3 family macrolide efflux protein-like MFS transporter
MAGGGPPSFGRNVLLLWGGQLVSATGDALFLAGVQWLALAVTGRDAAVGGVGFALALPYLVVGPLAGVLADRFDRRRLMIASDLARAAVLLPLPWVARATGGPTFGLLCAVAVLVGTFSSPFAPARDALLPDLARGRPLLRWNAAFQTSAQVATILGLAVGGWLLSGETRSSPESVARVTNVLAYDGATFVVSAVTLCFLRLPRRVSTRTVSSPRVGAELREGLRYARTDPVVRPLLVLTALDNLAIMGPATVGALLLVTETFGLSAGHYAWFEAAMVLGMLLGSLTLARGAVTLSPGRLVLWGMVLDGLTYLPFVFLRDYALALVLIAVHGFFIPFIVVGRTTLLQAHVPEDRRGKVFALVALTVTGMTALSALFSGWIADLTSPHALFGIAGTFGALCGVVGLRRLGSRLATR